MDYFSLIMSRRKQRTGDSAEIADGPAITAGKNGRARVTPLTSQPQSFSFALNLKNNNLKRCALSSVI
jgi:hypothetical protein